MRQKRRVFMDTCLVAILIDIVWQILEMVFYGKVQPRIVDDVIWLILFRYIYLAKKRKAELYEIKEKPFMIPCPPRMREKEMEKKNSECIGEFIKFLRRVQKRDTSAQLWEEKADKETQDILHRIELYDDNRQDKEKLMDALKITRQHRRDAKDTQIGAGPILKWLKKKEHLGLIKELEQLLWEVKEAEKSTQDRRYINKTDIVKRTLEAAGERQDESMEV